MQTVQRAPRVAYQPMQRRPCPPKAYPAMPSTSTACAAAAGRPHRRMRPRRQLSPPPSAGRACPAPPACSHAGPPAWHTPPERQWFVGLSDRELLASRPGSSPATPAANVQVLAVDITGADVRRLHACNQFKHCLHHCLPLQAARLFMFRARASDLAVGAAAHLGSAPVACAGIQPHQTPEFNVLVAVPGRAILQALRTGLVSSAAHRGGARPQQNTASQV